MAASYLQVLPLHGESKMLYDVAPTCWSSLITHRIYFFSKTLSPTSMPLHVLLLLFWLPCPLRRGNLPPLLS